MRAQASTRSGAEPGPIVAYLRIFLETGVTGPSGAFAPRTAVVIRVRSAPARSGRTRASAASRVLPVEQSSTAAACSRSPGREAAAITVIPPMECPASTALRPGASVAARTASRSSASAFVL